MALLHYNPPMQPYLQFVYRDEHIIVLDKPAGLLTVPGKAPEHHDSLISRVQRVLPGARIVHRLDMATSGLLVLALDKDSHRHLSRQFETRQTDKLYYARVFGCPAELEGQVDLPLICDWPNRPKQMVDHQRGKPSLTYWKLVSPGQQSCLVALTPHTGRSHQLRVHMQQLGHPILGDRLYAHPEALAASGRLLLHASELALTHPVSGERLTFTSPCPFD